MPRSRTDPSLNAPGSESFEIPPYFLQLVTCPKACSIVCRRETRHANGAIYLPRGSYSEGVPGEVRLLVVLANPGTPLPEEGPRFDGLKGPDLATACWKLTGEVLHGTFYSKSFDVMRNELAHVLGVPTKDVYRHVVLANVVHCSTPETITSYRAAEIRPVVDECVERHLQVEIDYWRPEQIVAYSAFARRHMDRLGVHYDASIDHPAMRGDNLKTEVRAEKVARLKETLERGRCSRR